MLTWNRLKSASVLYLVAGCICGVVGYHILDGTPAIGTTHSMLAGDHGKAVDLHVTNKAFVLYEDGHVAKVEVRDIASQASK